jgi:putative membrane-bound dehydrogenase-like protein
MSEHNPPRGRIEHWIWNRVSAGCWILGLALGASLFASADEVASPLSPADELATMRLADERLVMELVVAEPDVVDPVACAWDAWGRLYVVEMRDYPTGPRGGTIKRLVDRDGDGCYEDVKVFADEFNFPTSVLPWRDGVLVSAAPEVLFLQDTDGDGRADQRRVLLTGFAEGNQQLRVNGLTWGLDGWIYGANGRSDGQIRRVGDDPKEAVSLRRHDFRFRPDTGEFETTTGPSQFGLARDDWGNRFLSWNINPLRHVVIEESYLARNPSLAAGGAEDLIDFATEGRGRSIARACGISTPVAASRSIAAMSCRTNTRAMRWSASR